MQIQLAYTPLFKSHNAGPGHPERPARLDAIVEGLDHANLTSKIVTFAPEPCDERHLNRVHTTAHVQRVLDSDGTPTMFDGDTRTSKDSIQAALAAAGAACQAVDIVLEDPVTTVFSAGRPPGHHAESTRAMGFCLFNNVAVAAAYAIEERGLERVMVFDPDVHHGNGTQEIFYANPSVYYASIHQWPFYPGTGHATETGTGPGTGTTTNIPLPGGCGDPDYSTVSAALATEIQDWNPQLILFSAGFDAHHLDPLGGMNVTTNGFRQIFGPFCLAARSAEIPFAFLLEGGYSLQALAESVPAILQDCAQESWPVMPVVESGDRIADLVQSIVAGNRTARREIN